MFTVECLYMFKVTFSGSTVHISVVVEFSYLALHVCHKLTAAVMHVISSLKMLDRGGMYTQFLMSCYCATGGGTIENL